ncbi:hypothetical protein [Nostoc sp. CENA543]|uniref:hypothetical protein n=1 Tax=Nostoc sp. CENA543 TaxID=1869241 RepID=UPI0013000964|nr:hypothetical protein [Nostoc sp. CENA543]
MTTVILLGNLNLAKCDRQQDTSKHKNRRSPLDFYQCFGSIYEVNRDSLITHFEIPVLV